MLKSLVAVVALMMLVAPARADSGDTDPLTTQTQFLPAQVVRRPLVLTHGMIELSVHAEASLVRRANFEPLSVAPDLRYGLTDSLTIGLIHSNESIGFVGAVGNGLCLGGARASAEAGAPAVCAHVYNSTGLEAIYSLWAGGTPWTMALHGYSMLRGHGDTVPFGATSGAGVRARWAKKRLAVQLDPAVAVSFTRGGDTELLAQVFARAQYQVSGRFAASAGVGYYGPVDEMGAVPVAVGMLFAVDNNIDVAANAAIIDVSDTIDARSLTISFLYRM